MIDGTQPKNSSDTRGHRSKIRTDDLSSSMATRPQEVSLNLANVKFSSPQHFQIQSLKLTVWFRAVKRRLRRRGRDKRKKKRKIYTKEEEDSRIINAYDKAPLRHISPDTGVINFARRRKTIDRSPEVSLGVTRGVNIRRAGLRYSRIRYNHDPV